MRRGFSLPELVLALALVGAAASILLPSARARLDGLAVAAAREAAAAFFARARAEAPGRGGAVVWLEEPGVLRLLVDDELLEEADLVALFQVRMEIAGPSTSAEIRYDALGIGRVASRTLLFRRGGAEARLVISAYGRVSRP